MALFLPGFGEGRVGLYPKVGSGPLPSPASGRGRSQFTGTFFIPLNTNFWMRFPSWTSVT